MRSAAIEAEGELIEVVIQMLGADRSLVCAKQPSFQQRHHPVNSGQKFTGRLLATTQHRHVMLVAIKPVVAFPAVGMRNTARFDTLADEAVQAHSRCVRDATQPYPADSRSVLLGTDHHQGFLPPLPPTDALFPPAKVRFVDLD